MIRAPKGHKTKARSSLHHEGEKGDVCKTYVGESPVHIVNEVSWEHLLRRVQERYAGKG